MPPRRGPVNPTCSGTGTPPSAQAIVEGNISATGAVSITAVASDSWTLAAQTLTTDTSYTVGATALAEIRGAAEVAGGSLLLTADTVVQFSWDGVANDVDGGLPTDPDGVDGAVRVNVMNSTLAGIGGTAAVTIGATDVPGELGRSVAIAATDTVDIHVAIEDTTDYGAINPNVIAIFLEFGRLLAATNISRDTQAYVSAAPLSGDALAADAGARVSAHNTGTVDASIDSTIVGKVVNTVTKDDALASVTATRVSAADLLVESLTDSELAAAGKIARNHLTGTTQATIAGTIVSTDGGDVTLTAHDATALTAEAGTFSMSPPLA